MILCTLCSKQTFFFPNLFNVDASFTHSGSVLRFAEVILDSELCTLELIFFLCLDHRIIDSLGIEKTSKIIRSIVNLTPLCLPLNHVIKCHIHVPFEHPQGW